MSRVAMSIKIEPVEVLFLGRTVHRVRDHLLDRLRPAGVTAERCVERKHWDGGVVVEVFGVRSDEQGWDADGAPTSEWPVEAIPLEGSR